MSVTKESILKAILLKEFDRMQPEVSTFEDDPMQFILRKYEGLNKTLTYLMTPSFQDYITGIYIVAPKPTTFKVVLHNGQFFFLEFTGKTYEATVAGKGYYLMNIGEKERCMRAIARLLRYGNPIKTKGPEGAEQGTRSEDEVGGETAGGEETGGEEAPAEEEPIAEAKILEEVLKKTLIEARQNYEYLSLKAQKVGDEIINALNIPKEEIKAASKNKIIVFTDIPRKEVFSALEKLGYKKEQVSGSSAGGYVSPDGVEIIQKSKSTGTVGGAGIANEKEFTNNINDKISASPDQKLNITIEANRESNLVINNVISAQNIGKEGEKKGWKGDARLIQEGNKAINVSIKEDGDFRWASVMVDLKDFYDEFMKKASRGEIPNLELKQDPNNPKVLQMWNTSNNKPYGRIYIKNHPQVSGKENLEKVAFGSDNAVIIQKTFNESDFIQSGNKLTIKVTKIIRDINDFEKGDYPILEFERNASKATKTTGLRGRGIILRVSPIKRLEGAGSKANNLVLDYEDIK